MDVNSKNVEALAKQKRDDNHALRQHLKEQDRLSEQELDQLVFDITRRVWAGIDCTTCANCCKELTPGVTDEEAQRLAARLGLSVEDFRSHYLKAPSSPGEDSEHDADDARWRIRGKPCPFLEGNRCSVYEDRPAECRGYPYLYEPEFSRRTLGMIERTFTCPVVYRVFEELKAELPFRRRSRRWESWQW
jgi:Fe-S-cluster containining protein